MSTFLGLDQPQVDSLDPSDANDQLLDEQGVIRLSPCFFGLPTGGILDAVPALSGDGEEVTCTR